MKNLKSILFVLAYFILQISIAQNYKFGKVSKEELQETYYPQDSSAKAAYLFKKRRTYSAVYGNTLQLVTEIQSRVKIYSKDGADWAAEEIKLYRARHGDPELVSGLKAVTYNLEGDKIVETKLNKDNIFKEETSDNWTTMKFTMPNLQEGSVVEWTYKIISPYYMYIDDVIVQYKIPVKTYDTSIQLLEYFQFNKRQKGYYYFKINESRKNNLDLNTNDRYIEIYEKNVPAIKEEPYINNLDNYTAGIQFEVAALNAPRLGLFENFASTWEEIVKNIYKNSSFGGELDKKGFFKDDLPILQSKLTTNEAKIVGALDYVRSKVKWNGNYGVYTQKGLRKAFDENSGNVGDINLALVNILRQLGLNANPVLVSTRSHGIPIFPTSRGFNYVIASVEHDNNLYLLDGTANFSTPNVLPIRAMNWYGRLVREDGTSTSINLFPKAHSKEIVFGAFVLNEDDLITGKLRTSYTHQLAMNYRSSKNSLSDNEIMEELENDYGNIELTKLTFQNKENIYEPLIVNMEFESEDLIETIGENLYFSPLLFLAKSENPFKLEKRQYPIDFGTPWNEKYTINIKLPEGYKIETLPEEVYLTLPDNIGSFKFMCKNTGTTIQVLSDVQINTSIIETIHYGALKELYKLIIDKQQEKVVLSKI